MEMLKASHFIRPWRASGGQLQIPTSHSTLWVNLRVALNESHQLPPCVPLTLAVCFSKTRVALLWIYGPLLSFSTFNSLHFHSFGTVFDTYLISLIEAFHVSSTQPYFKIFVKVRYKMIELIMTIWHKMTWHTHDCRTHAGG